MSTSVISVLQRKRQEYVNRIVNNRNKIRSCERSHESLSDFKAIVERSQEDFYEVNSGKSVILSEVDLIKQNSRIAQNYYTGMQNIFNGIGSKIIGVVYSVLLSTISIRLKNYVNTVNDCDDDIAYYERKIRDIDLQIKEIERIKALERAVLGGEM